MEIDWQMNYSNGLKQIEDIGAISKTLIQTIIETHFLVLGNLHCLRSLSVIILCTIFGEKTEPFHH